MRFTLDIVEQKDGSVTGRQFAQSAIQSNPVNRPTEPDVIYRTCVQNGAFTEVIGVATGIERDGFYVIGSQSHQNHVYGQAI
jgi:hypothetical protein